MCSAHTPVRHQYIAKDGPHFNKWVFIGILYSHVYNGWTMIMIHLLCDK
jgi:hypothetical protein